jgi:hypothetical protein
VKVLYGILAIPLAGSTLLMSYLVAHTVYENTHGFEAFQPVIPGLIEALAPVLLWWTGLLGFRLMRRSNRSWVAGAVAFLITVAVAIAFRLMPFIIYVIEYAARPDLPSGPVLP